jgi:hypothetical protein
MRGKPLCAEISAENAEPLHATASRVEHWVLIEYRGLWASDLLRESRLTADVKAHLQKQLGSLPRSRLLFIRRSRRPHNETLTVYVGRTSEHDSALLRFELDGYDDLLQLDMGRALQERVAELDAPLLLVCTHGKRDRCCARYGRPLYDAIREEVEPEWVWQVSHIGGDRFAGNLLCLPHGLYFGRVGRHDVWPLLDEYLAGRIYLERFRGRCWYGFAVQAAEHTVRAHSGIVGLDDLRLSAVERTREHTWSVALEVIPTGDVHRVDVRAELGELTYLTCAASSLQRPRRFVATAHRIEAASGGSPRGRGV